MEFVLMFMERIIIYDGSCALCNSAVRFVSSHTRNVRFSYVSRQSEEGWSLVELAGSHFNNLDSIIYQRGSEYFLRSTAILNILKDIGGGWKVLYFLIIIPPFIRDRIYSFIARNRRLLFKPVNQCRC